MAAACQRKARRGSSSGEPARGPGKAGGGGGGARPVGEQADGGGVGAEVSSAVEVRLKEKLTCGPHTSVREGREVAGVFWTILKYTGLRVGPRTSKTYKMARFKEEKNCNGTIQNT